MTDKYDEMPPEQVAEATLAMMGYEKAALIPWWHKEDGDLKWGWGPYGALARRKHAFAAEVKGQMMRSWHCDDDFYSGAVDSVGCEGHINFYKTLYHKDDDNYSYELSGMAEYADMASHPRAVCLAALRAKEAERDA